MEIRVRQRDRDGSGIIVGVGRRPTNWAGTIANDVEVGNRDSCLRQGSEGEDGDKTTPYTPH